MRVNGLSNLLNDKRIEFKGPKIVVIGGGTGLSTMLRGLKAFSSNITAIVTVADDGGGSGLLRQDLGMLPPGDIRNCLVALANTEPVMQQLMQYRFKEGILKGQSFGNLFLAAMNGISLSFEEAVQRMSDVLAVTGRVLPVTLDDVVLCAELEDGFTICGESKIGQHNMFHKGRIKRVYLKPEFVSPLKDVLDAIRDADAIVLGPGSLYTSIIPNLLVGDICGYIKKSKAVKVYVCNVMTQPGETDGYTASEHLKALYKHAFDGVVDYCIVNSSPIPKKLEKEYIEDGAERVEADYKLLENLGVGVIAGDFVSIFEDYIRHNSQKLAASIVEIIAETILIRDKRRIIDYYYVKDKLRREKWSMNLEKVIGRHLNME